MTGLVEKKSRRIIIFFIVGICCAVFASEVNGLMTKMIPLEITDLATRVTPVTEEIIKAAPILFFARVISDRREVLITISLAVGIGFAIMENTFILTQSVDSVSLLWAILRGLGTGIMHGMCTFLVGLGITLANKNKKLFVVGTFALLSLAITYHAVFNMLVSSPLKYLGAALPIITYLPFLWWRFKNTRKDSTASA